MRLVSLEMLDSNMILARDIVNRGNTILRKGLSGINKYSARLKKLGISYIYIEDDTCNDIIVPDVITDDTRKLCKNTLFNTMTSLLQKEKLNINELNASIEHIIYDISNREVKQSLADIRTIDEYTFSHSISTTVYALLIGRSLNYNSRLLEQLAIGALLHDIGKILLDSHILYKKETLSYAELLYVRKHVSEGYKYVKDRTEIPEASKKIVLSHHERMDGSGYPNKLKGNQLDEFSRIVGIADVYDALISDRCYRRKWKRNSAFKYLLENCETKFDPELIRLFIKNIAVYPNGSTVRMSDGRMALIKEQNNNMPLRPIVKVFTDRNCNFVPLEEIDLMKVLSLTIIDSELELNNNDSWMPIDI